MNSVWALYRRWDTITGWFLFVISSAVYLLTIEPTVSFWDCGEFILCAFGLQVGHPPGAPLFIMIGRIATLFAGGDTSQVALTMNIFSALCSGLAIMLLFWTITHLVRKIYDSGIISEPKQILPVIGSGIIGALAYTFSDTFWFSAVEGELYAASSLFTALVFWAMLKWEDEADKPCSGRWIILIAYIMGLGIGIHRLNLLVIPVLVFVFYFRKYEISVKGVLKTLLASIFIIWFVVFFIIPGVPKAAGWFELLFVNGFGLPFQSGTIFFMVLTGALLIVGIRYSMRSQRVILNYILTSLTVIMIGYSSYAMIVIRSSARPPMNQNDPSNIFSLSYYINMEQYGSSPKIYGHYYSAPVVDAKNVVAGYNKIDGKYVSYYRPEYEYSEQFSTIFPRMYSPEPDHEVAYKYWGKITGRRYTVGSGTAKETIVCPTFGENLRYFFRYQVGYMYFRYFMWNFAGRQNDVQGNGNPLHGNWISGIKFIDEARLGNLENVPSDLKNNKGRNVYFFLPFLIGVAGAFWQYKRYNKGFWLVLAFFIMTGLAIILYLNQYPNQPRERDYAYAGSFYAFAIWIGMGFMLLYEKLSRVLDGRISAGITFIVLMIACPVLMGVQNWDDHNRSGRYTARDIGANYLKSCAPNAVLFTYGDNDSFPVWYVQDVEAVRTDIRVANLSYIQAGWYVEMMRQKAFESDPMPLSLGPEKYIDGVRVQIPVISRVDKPVDLAQAVEFVGQDDRKFMVDVTGRGDYYNFLPANKFIINVDPDQVVANGTVKEYYKERIVSPMIWEYTENNAFKGDLAMMDLLSTNNWERPVYISTTVPSSQYKGLEKFFVQEGLAYRVVPVETDQPEQGEFGMIDPWVMYDNMMNKFEWGNAEDPSVYLDEVNRRMFSNYRRIFGNLGKALLQHGDTTKAVEVAYRGLGLVPVEKMPDDFFSIGLAEVLIRSGLRAEGEKIIYDIIAYAKEYLDFAIVARAENRYGMDYPVGINMQALLDIYRMSVEQGSDSITTTLEPDLNNYYTTLYSVE